MRCTKFLDRLYRQVMPYAFSAFVTLALNSSSSQAGVFNLPHFATPGEFALGIEPELILTNGAGFGFNAYFTQGLNDLLNFRGVIGTGGGPRGFRAGGGVNWDFIPDLEGQPGIGLGLQALYVRVPDVAQVEVTATPYLHKAFGGKGSEIEPFFAFPAGMAFVNGLYRGIATANVGLMIQASEKFRFIGEVSVAVANSESSISGGVVYYH